MISFRQNKYDIFQSVQKHIKVSKMFFLTLFIYLQVVPRNVWRDRLASAGGGGTVNSVYQCLSLSHSILGPHPPLCRTSVSDPAAVCSVPPEV